MRHTAIFALGICVFTAGALPALAQSEDPAVTVCEETLKALVRSPATYRRISAGTSDNQVVVSFDSQNAFGAMLRNHALCRFRFDEEPGRFQLSQVSLNGEYVAVGQVVAARALATSSRPGLLTIASKTTSLRPQ